MKEINLRAHHILCTQGFQGYGYNEQFANNLMNFINSAKVESKIKINLSCKCDDICEKCPNNKKGVCIHEDVIHMDELILKELNLKRIIESNFEDLIKIANSKLKNHKKCNEICGRCSWKNVCLWFKEADKIYI